VSEPFNPVAYHGPSGDVNDPAVIAAVAKLADIRAAFARAQAPDRHSIYTAGYGAGWSPAMLAETLDRYAAILLDIRLKPWSKTMAWQKPSLQAHLGTSRYLHVPALGNLNYANGGSIVLQSPATGVRIVGEQLELHNVLLLCGCRKVASCHRTVAADLLNEALGAPIVHLEPPR